MNDILAENKEMDRRDLAELLGKSRHWVNRYMKLQDPYNLQLLEAGIFRNATDLLHYLSLSVVEGKKLLDRYQETGQPITRKEINDLRNRRKGVRFSLTQKSPIYSKLLVKARELNCTPEQALIKLASSALGVDLDTKK